MSASRHLNGLHFIQIEIDGRAVENYMGWLALSSALTVVGNPVTALPCGFDLDGTPFGIQCVGPMFGDHALLSNAAANRTVIFH